MCMVTFSERESSSKLLILILISQPDLGFLLEQVLLEVLDGDGSMSAERWVDSWGFGLKGIVIEVEGSLWFLKDEFVD